MAPAVSEVVKAATAKKTASEILAERPELKRDIDKALSDRLSKYNVFLDDVSIVNVQFTQEFNKAIEDKKIAQQQAEQSKFLVEKARSESEANQVRQKSLTPQILQQRAIEKGMAGFLPILVVNHSPLSPLILRQLNNSL